MGHRAAYRLVCSKCDASFDVGESLSRWRCDCGAPLDLDFQPKLTSGFPDMIAGREMTWLRYREALPFDAEAAVRLGEGCTPLLRITLGGTAFIVKQEQIAASGSFKDRGAFALVSHAKGLGVKEMIEDSSGNAGAAIAAYCGRAGIACRIFVPREAGSGKTVQIERYGAQVERVDGDREDTAAAARRAAEDIWYGSHVWNPFFFQGTKLFAYELWEQLGFAVPDTLVLPVGNGTLLIGAYLGFSELRTAGLSEKIPAIVGVQAAACAPLVAGFSDASPSETVASGIAIAEPARGPQILRMIEASGGAMIAVEEGEILETLEEVRRAGFTIEPTGAVALAGAKEAVRVSGRHGTTVSAFTGRGL